MEGVGEGGGGQRNIRFTLGLIPKLPSLFGPRGLFFFGTRKLGHEGAVSCRRFPTWSGNWSVDFERR